MPFKSAVIGLNENLSSSEHYSCSENTEDYYKWKLFNAETHIRNKFLAKNC